MIKKKYRSKNFLFLEFPIWFATFIFRKMDHRVVENVSKKIWNFSKNFIKIQKLIFLCLMVANTYVSKKIIIYIHMMKFICITVLATMWRTFYGCHFLESQNYSSSNRKRLIKISKFQKFFIKIKNWIFVIFFCLYQFCRVRNHFL